jgi:plastocyanin
MSRPAAAPEVTMRRSVLVFFALFVLSSGSLPAVASPDAPPVPEINFLTPINAGPCTPTPGNPYEAAQYKLEGWPGPDYVRYPGACKRLKFVFGPIHIKPGQNDVLIEPVTIQKPAYDGYIVRFRPDMVTLQGEVPPIEVMHLHHATWIQLGGTEYGDGPFFAAGEEKTVAPIPRGYGFEIKAEDTWGLLYMIHNQLQAPTEVFITYDIDYIAKDVADAPPISIKPVYPIWLDVLKGSGYPVFNVQRGFGTKGRCSWPVQNCAHFDPYGKPGPAQGLKPNSKGNDWALPADGQPLGRIPAFHGGTLMGLGGHLHPGGLSDDIDLVRGGKAKRILTSDAVYWDWKNPGKPGGSPTSWDMSMTVQGAPRWGIRVKPGDVLRINATYDTTHQATYEDMGIAVGFIAPDQVVARKLGPTLIPTAPGVDPFQKGLKVDDRPGCPSKGLMAKPKPVLCTRGFVSHGHLAEADNHSGPAGSLGGSMASHADRIMIGGFVYTPGDLGTVESLGIPTVSKGQLVEFQNLDAFTNVYHTVTSCRYPCTGPTGIAFPLANGASSTGKPIDFDSSTLGYGIPTIGPAKNDFRWSLEIGSAFDSGAVYTYFCRIHPFMRGAFAVE